MDEKNFKVTEIPYNMSQPKILVEMSANDAGKLLDGLKLAQDVPQVISTQLTMRC